MPCYIWVIIVTSVVFILWLALQFILSESDLPVERVDVDESSLRTGDILGVGNRKLMPGCIVRALTGSSWTHTGIVLREGDKVCVLEVARLKDGRMGSRCIPFSKWHDRRETDYRSLTRLVGPSLDSEEVRTFFQQFEGNFIPVSEIGWHRYAVPPLFRGQQDNYTCFEMTVKLLQHIGVVSKDAKLNSFYGGDLVWARLPLINDYSYENPVLI